MTRFAIAQPGSDAADPSVLHKVVDSLYPSPKINTKANPPHAGLIDLNWASSISVPNQTTKLLYQIPHGYNYIPGAFAGFSFDNGTTRISGTLPFSLGGIGLIILDADPTYVNLKYYSTDLASTTLIPPFTMLIRFYITADRGMNLSNPDPQ